MNVKIIAQYLAITCLLLCRALAVPVPSGGCYECEEEVWEEVPCDDIPTNATTTTTTSTTTTSTTTTSTTTTSTTPRPMPPTTEDPYKKCYCECKVGCKEFCRKVVVNPELKKQILQVSKITEPIAQGRLESTHYHQRELIPKKSYGSSYNPVFPGAYAAKSKYEADKYSALSAETPSRHYNSLPPPLYHVNSPGASSYVKAHATANNVGQEQSHGSYDYPTPCANAYSKLSKSVKDTLENNLKVSVATSNSIPGHGNYNGSPRHRSPYSYPTPVKSADNPLQLALSAGYDSVESYLKDIMQGSPSTNYQSFDGYGGHQYSMLLR